MNTRIPGFALVLLIGLASAPAWALDAKPRIIDGERVPESQFPTVGRFGDSDCLCCTGVLIAPQYILTAAHCVTDDFGNQDVADTAALFRLQGHTYACEKIYIHGSYFGGRPDEGIIDIAVVKLSAPISGVTPSPLYRKAPVLGEMLTIAGYGYEGTGLTGFEEVTPPDGYIDFGRTPLDDLSDTYLVWQFESGESNTAPGDSGGPVFITENGVLHVAGIASFGLKASARFGDIAYNIRVDTVRDWIDHIVNGVNQAPVVASAITVEPSDSDVFVPAQLTVTTTDPDQDRLVFNWDFGDGTSLSDAGPTVQHAYSASGTYTAHVTIHDKLGGSVSNSATVTIASKTFREHTSGDNVPVAALKRKFSIVFKSYQAAYDITFTSLSEFGFQAPFEFSSAVTGKRAYFLVNGELQDSISLFGTGKGIGAGNLKWNWKKGEVRYTLKKSDPVPLVLAGASLNSDTTKNINVPIHLVIEGVRYGGNYQFLYSSKAFKSGKGK